MVVALALALLAPAMALTLQKTVTGAELVDLNDSLQVVLTIESQEPVRLESLTDPVPAHFMAVAYPSSCQPDESQLVCNMGQDFSGTTTLTYSLVAVSTGYGLIGGPTLTYEGGVKTTDFFRQYFVGKPRISLELEGETTFLPGTPVIQAVLLRNTGVRAVNDARVEVTAGNFSLSRTFSLNPEEMLRLSLELGNAPNTGTTKLEARVIWTNQTTATSRTLLFVSPGMEATRTVTTHWQRDSQGGQLQSQVKAVYQVKNNGTALGNFTFSSGESFILEPGERRTVEQIYPDKAPAVKLSLRDRQGTVHASLTFPEETPEAKKGFFVLLYEYVARGIPWWLLLLGATVPIYLAVKFKGTFIKLGLLALSAVCLLLLGSHLSVGGLAVPAVVSGWLSGS
mgnify:CR=1 FL=1